jgi:uncharacterized protein
MTLSMHRLSVPVFLRALGVLSGLLEKAAAFAEANGIDPAVLVNARLAPDMLPLAGQVQRASDTAKSAIGRLAGIEIPSFPDTETSFADLQARIAKTSAFVKGVAAEQMKGSEERQIALNLPAVKTTLRGEDYLLGFVLPNFFFHVTTAYDILRHNGLKIGKLDYIGRPG